jgi:hypothetical protein
MDDERLDRLERTVQWLKDVELIKSVPQRYAYGIDTRDFDAAREMFRDDCFVEGTLQTAAIADYWPGLCDGVRQYHATLHFMGNQLVRLEEGADEGFVETYAVAYHIEAPTSTIDDLVMGVRYQDTVAREGDDWRIVRRKTVPQWVRGPLPRPR